MALVQHQHLLPASPPIPSFHTPSQYLADMGKQHAVVAGLGLAASMVNAAPAPQVINAAAAASCVTTTYAASAPTNTATAVQLEALSYCGGTLYAAAYIEVGVVLSHLARCCLLTMHTECGL